MHMHGRLKHPFKGHLYANMLPKYDALGTFQPMDCACHVILSIQFLRCCACHSLMYCACHVTCLISSRHSCMAVGLATYLLDHAALAAIRSSQTKLHTLKFRNMVSTLAASHNFGAERSAPN